MPELPEVETTCRGIAPHVTGRLIKRLAVHEPRLRWRVDPKLPAWAEGQRIRGVHRRAKYLLIELERGHLLVHLGMSGSLRVLPTNTARETHDHFDLEMDSGWLLRFNDPRRFGSLMHLTGDPAEHPLLRHLAPEPLDKSFRRAIKPPHRHAWPQGRHQDRDHEQPARGRCRQYLCERIAVPRRHPPGARRARA